MKTEKKKSKGLALLGGAILLAALAACVYFKGWTMAVIILFALIGNNMEQRNS